MREIKFRVWCETNIGNEMVYLDEGEFDNGYWFSCPDRISHIDNYLSGLMQYTGLKDKNKKLIYEGDIVSFEKRMYEVVINFNGYYLQRYKLWRGKFVPAHIYALSLITKPSKDRFSGEVDSAEVIGNIHENPTLLQH